MFEQNISHCTTHNEKSHLYTTTEITCSQNFHTVVWIFIMWSVIKPNKFQIVNFNTPSLSQFQGIRQNSQKHQIYFKTHWPVLFTIVPYVFIHS